MIEKCIVKKLRRGIAYIELKRSDKCDGCKMCAFNKRNVMTVPAVCDITVSVGDTVAVQMPTRSVGAVALLIYVLPILGILVGALIGLAGQWQLQLILASVGLALGLAAIIPLERLYRKHLGVLPVVISVEQPIKTENTENGEINNGT